jgi:uncharacterized membrane protein
MPGLNNLLNIHPLFVHFPIALTLVAALFVVLHLATRRADFISMGSMLIYLSAISAVVTTITGYGAANIIGHESPNHELVHIHRDIMLWYTIWIITLAILQGLARNEVWSWLGHWSMKAVRLILLFGAVVILIKGTDRGGQLVFEFGIGVRESEEERGEIMDNSMDQMDKTSEWKSEEDDDHSGHEH